ncbi:hypothetical protein AQUCO_00700517v1 [Aquilegia coerulea]|uniref:Uncharacterized protein n=1 Tax=Aquilegia coerulea TaxID=218851 RepID=A0A2G5EKC7_AQUCA|nr:hypothetical protein AQUCO_00700517v1 [Aquilegia coerulea]
MALLGEDGLGYELATKLESCGVWRSWLGESNYTNFINFLISPSTWETFMTNTTNTNTNTDISKTRAQIHLQLRVRALLFDKASVSLFLRSSPSTSSSSSTSTSSSLSSSYSSPSNLNSAYLQLHGDDVYFSLEDFSYCLQDKVQHQDASVLSKSRRSKIQPKLKYGEPEADDVSNRPIRDALPETWYNQFIEKYRLSRQYKLLSGDQEPLKRTSEGMSTYLKNLERHKRSRKAFKDDQCIGFDNPSWENGSNLHQKSISNSSEDETHFFPEMMFPSNCVPDSALPPTVNLEDGPKVECYGVLDSLPHVMTRSPAMLERFGIMPEYLRSGLGRSKYRGKNGLEGNGKSLGQEQALQMSQKVIARVLENVGFEGATEVPIEVLSQFLSCHICKLGRILKVLTDNYRKQCSAIEVLKMFLQTVGYRNIGTLADHVKDGTKNVSQPTQQQHVRGHQSGLHPQHQNLNLQSQQILRQMNPQMQMGIPQPQNLAFQQQQQWERMRRRQTSAPRAGMNLEKDRPIVEVKLENIADSPMDANAFAPSNNRHPQMQFRQQAAAMPNLHAQSGHQFRQLSPLQVPQLQTHVRAPPVKVEGFQELMGGDTSLKHDSEEYKLTSPSNSNR